ncbi:eukaryotic initiation factor 4a [Plakobranchus ocellatus]|uniref:RNA helicase n=1 Tax=Plakobranchus ocellatus TaxID=259542 RepID=A0AAV3Y3L3_9GAST|nr:eukaryotic initiation factor 4a [Plakobranchus ocellatus]
MSIAHNLDEKARTGDVLITEAVDFPGLLLSKRVLKGLANGGFQKPSPIQLKAIPLGRCGLDLIVQAKSGTGKTCVFSVVALESVDITSICLQVLVLAPTREIAQQIQDVIRVIGSDMPGLKCHTFIGGMPVLQDKILCKNCHIAVGTPGRVKQLLEIGALKANSIRLFVLDEADKLLEENFQESINWIYSALPENKQILALSATYPEYLAQHLTDYMRNPTFVRLNATDPALLGIKQYHVVVPHHPMLNNVFKAKTEAVLKIISSVTFQQCLIFSNMQTRAQDLQSELQIRNWPTACIAGCLQQEERSFAMEQLKAYKCRILISTDLTSRGIDADKVNLVINLDVPPDHETYLHRIGRAGRFGSFGAAVTILSKGAQEKELWRIEKLCKTYIHKLPDPPPKDLVTKSLPVRLDDVVSTEQIINCPGSGSNPESADPGVVITDQIIDCPGSGSNPEPTGPDVVSTEQIINCPGSGSNPESADPGVVITEQIIDCPGSGSNLKSADLGQAELQSEISDMDKIIENDSLASTSLTKSDMFPETVPCVADANMPSSENAVTSVIEGANHVEAILPPMSQDMDKNNANSHSNLLSVSLDKDKCQSTLALPPLNSGKDVEACVTPSDNECSQNLEECVSNEIAPESIQPVEDQNDEEKQSESDEAVPNLSESCFDEISLLQDTSRDQFAHRNKKSIDGVCLCNDAGQNLQEALESSVKEGSNFHFQTTDDNSDFAVDRGKKEDKDESTSPGNPDCMEDELKEQIHVDSERAVPVTEDDCKQLPEHIEKMTNEMVETGSSPQEIPFDNGKTESGQNQNDIQPVSDVESCIEESGVTLTQTSRNLEPSQSGSLENNGELCRPQSESYESADTILSKAVDQSHSLEELDVKSVMVEGNAAPSAAVTGVCHQETLATSDNTAWVNYADSLAESVLIEVKERMKYVEIQDNPASYTVSDAALESQAGPTKSEEVPGQNENFSADDGSQSLAITKSQIQEASPGMDEAKVLKCAREAHVCEEDKIYNDSEDLVKGKSNDHVISSTKQGEGTAFEQLMDSGQVIEDDQQKVSQSHGGSTSTFQESASANTNEIQVVSVESKGLTDSAHIQWIDAHNTGPLDSRGVDQQSNEMDNTNQLDQDSAKQERPGAFDPSSTDQQCNKVHNKGPLDHKTGHPGNNDTVSQTQSLNQADSQSTQDVFVSQREPSIKDHEKKVELVSTQSARPIAQVAKRRKNKNFALVDFLESVNGENKSLNTLKIGKGGLNSVKCEEQSFIASLNEVTESSVKCGNDVRIEESNSLNRNSEKVKSRGALSSENVTEARQKMPSVNADTILVANSDEEKSLYVEPRLQNPDVLLSMITSECDFQVQCSFFDLKRRHQIFCKDPSQFENIQADSCRSLLIAEGSLDDPPHLQAYCKQMQKKVEICRALFEKKEKDARERRKGSEKEKFLDENQLNPVMSAMCRDTDSAEASSFEEALQEHVLARRMDSKGGNNQERAPLSQDFPRCKEKLEVHLMKNKKVSGSRSETSMQSKDVRGQHRKPSPASYDECRTLDDMHEEMLRTRKMKRASKAKEALESKENAQILETGIIESMSLSQENSVDMTFRSGQSKDLTSLENLTASSQNQGLSTFVDGSDAVPQNASEVCIQQLGEIENDTGVKLFISHATENDQILFAKRSGEIESKPESQIRPCNNEKHEDLVNESKTPVTGRSGASKEHSSSRKSLLSKFDSVDNEQVKHALSGGDTRKMSDKTGKHLLASKNKSRKNLIRNLEHERVDSECLSGKLNGVEKSLKAQQKSQNFVEQQKQQRRYSNRVKLHRRQTNIGHHSREEKPSKPSKTEARLAGLEVSDGPTSSSSSSSRTKSMQILSGLENQASDVEEVTSADQDSDSSSEYPLGNFAHRVSHASERHSHLNPSQFPYPPSLYSGQPYWPGSDYKSWIPNHCGPYYTHMSQPTIPPWYNPYHYHQYGYYHYYPPCVPPSYSYSSWYSDYMKSLQSQVVTSDHPSATIPSHLQATMQWKYVLRMTQQSIKLAKKHQLAMKDSQMQKKI